MTSLPITKDPLVIRTDFSNQDAWDEVCTLIKQPDPDFGFLAHVNFISDKTFQDLGKDELLARVPKNYQHGFIIVADQLTISHPEHPLLIIDLYDEPGSAFHAIPSQIQGIENNLSISNMDFEEFAGAVDADGVFRGF